MHKIKLQSWNNQKFALNLWHSNGSLDLDYSTNIEASYIIGSLKKKSWTKCSSWLAVPYMI